MQNDRIYFVFDDPGDREKMKVLLNYETKKYVQVFPDNKLRTPKQMLLFVNEFIARTNNGDAIVFWYDFMGILCYLICKLKGIKRKIIILNILLKDKPTIKNRIAKFLYRFVLKDNTVITTVTSKEYGIWVNNLLKLNREHYLLHDIYYGDEVSNTTAYNNTVFCGGRNGRDWDKVIEIANKMPSVRFNCVMPGDIWRKKEKDFPHNVVAEYDIPENEFLDILKSSKIVIMPLDTESPAGLVAIFQAGMYNKMVIASNTVTMREYITPDKGVLCTQNADDWVKNIEHSLNNDKETADKARKFNYFLNDVCSASKYAETLFNIVEENKNG